MNITIDGVEYVPARTHLADAPVRIVMPREMICYRGIGEDLDRYPFDEYDHVVGTEWWEDDDEPVRLRRERWVLLEEQDGTYYPHGTLESCGCCDGEGVIVEGADPDDLIDCPECAGDGVVDNVEGFIPDAVEDAGSGGVA